MPAVPALAPLLPGNCLPLRQRQPAEEGVCAQPLFRRKWLQSTCGLAVSKGDHLKVSPNCPPLAHLTQVTTRISRPLQVWRPRLAQRRAGYRVSPETAAPQKGQGAAQTTPREEGRGPEHRRDCFPNPVLTCNTWPVQRRPPPRTSALPALPGRSPKGCSRRWREWRRPTDPAQLAPQVHGPSLAAALSLLVTSVYRRGASSELGAHARSGSKRAPGSVR